MAGAGAAAGRVLGWGDLASAQIVTALVAACLFSFLPASERLTQAFGRAVERWTPHAVLLRFAVAVLLLGLSASALATGAFNPFIYFRF